MTTETVSRRVVTTLPSDIKQVGIVLKYDILKHLYNRRLVGMIAIQLSVQP